MGDLQDNTNVDSTPVAADTAPAQPEAPKTVSVPVSEPATDPAPAEAPTEPATPPAAPDEGAYDLDLDLIQPQTKRVKLGDQIYEVSPPKVKDIAELIRASGNLRKGNAQDTEDGVTAMLKVFERLIPALKNEGVDLSLAQVMALFQFVTAMSSPNENSALKALGVEPTQEKKAPSA